jgi:hypothetical protein
MRSLFLRSEEEKTVDPVHDIFETFLSTQTLQVEVFRCAGVVKGLSKGC